MIQLHENTVVADRFRLVKMIGRGGMGSVWSAVHIGLDTPCALKFIEGELIKVAEAHERFEREAKVSAQLHSPHIVQIIDHGVWQDRPYIAMELLEGDDLGKKIAQGGGRLGPLVVNMVVQQVCRALTKAHGAGVVHRDLKPDNIFLVNDDDRQLVKILDFGVAKNTGQAIENSNTKTGAMLGTPYYMSPEQAQGIKSVDARSDLWSVAVIVYQCITGRLPFESEALGDLLVKIIVQPIPVPSQVALVPPGFDKWWAKAADRNPDNRFQTAKELAAQLELALNLTQGIGNNGPSSDPLMGTALLQQPGAYGGSMPTSNMQTPPPHMQSARPMMQTPAPPFQSPQNPATFSGVEPPATLPKNGVPVAMFAVFAVLALVGIAGAGIAVTKRTAGSSTPPAPAITVSPTTPMIEKTADIPPPPIESTVTPPPPTAEPDTSAASTTVKPVPTAHTNGSATTATQAPTAPAPATGPKPAPTSSAKKKWDPGF